MLKRHRPRPTAILALLLLPLTAVVVGVILLTTSRAALLPSDTALATLKLPLGGAKVTSLSAVIGREAKDLPVKLVGDQVYPVGKVPTRQPVTIEATVAHPGWDSWVTGARQRVKLRLTTPASSLTSSFVTVRHGQPMNLRFSEPVAVVGYASAGSALTDRRLPRPETSLAITPASAAGTLTVAAAPRSWEIPARQDVSWFPAGAAGTVIATPSPGSTITAQTPIRMTFSSPVRQALSGHLPTVTPAGSGQWKQVGAHTIEFVPTGAGYGLGAQVQIALPAELHVADTAADPAATWSVPPGSTTRLQQLLAALGYLPVQFTQHGDPVSDTLASQEAAAVTPPPGSFSWRYPNTPSALQAQWQPGVDGELTHAAVMSFEYDHDLGVDGIAGPQVWTALLHATLTHETSSFGYTFVYVHEASSDETETTWHDGRDVVSGPVNTGLPAAGGTAPGVFAVFEHVRSTTMSGLNPDGSSYSDPGVPYVSYFDKGDALHGFLRHSYGFPQSDGCVEMPYSEAGDVYPYTPVGTVVDVSTS